MERVAMVRAAHRSTGMHRRQPLEARSQRTCTATSRRSRLSARVCRTFPRRLGHRHAHRPPYRLSHRRAQRRPCQLSQSWMLMSTLWRCNHTISSVTRDPMFWTRIQELERTRGGSLRSQKYRHGTAPIRIDEARHIACDGARTPALPHVTSLQRSAPDREPGRAPMRDAPPPPAQSDPWGSARLQAISRAHKITIVG